MKIGLDTNVVVSGLLNSQGNPAKVLTLALAGAVQVCHDKRILAEYREVLVRARFRSIQHECEKFWPSSILTACPWMRANMVNCICRTAKMNRSWQWPWLPQRIFWLQEIYPIIRRTGVEAAPLFLLPRSLRIGGSRRLNSET